MGMVSMAFLKGKSKADLVASIGHYRERIIRLSLKIENHEKLIRYLDDIALRKTRQEISHLEGLILHVSDIVGNMD